MLGVAILIVVMSVMNGFKTDLTKKILGLNPHIVIQPNNFKIEDSFIVNLEKTIKNIDISKTYSGEGIVVSRDNAKGIIIKGVDIKNKKTLNFFEQNISSGSIDNFKRNTAFIGTELSFNLNLKVGDKINLMSSAFVATPFGGLPKQETLTIAGVFNTGFFEFDQNFVFLNLSDALSIFDKEMYEQNLEIYLSDPMKADGLKKVIQKQNENYYIYSWTDLNKSFFSALKVERNVMFIILTLILIVAAFNIISGLTILVKNKTREIAILKSIGVLNKSIIKIFFLIGMIIGTSATIFGIILGVTFSMYVENLREFLTKVFNISLFPEEIYFLSTMPSEINPASLFIISLCSISITIIVSIFPAFKAAKLDPIKSLKYE